MTFVSRLSNQAAHALARFATAQDVDKVWFHDLPIWIWEIIDSENSSLTV
jgi:hypothetical protein